MGKLWKGMAAALVLTVAGFLLFMWATAWPAEARRGLVASFLHSFSSSHAKTPYRHHRHRRAVRSIQSPVQATKPVLAPQVPDKGNTLNLGPLNVVHFGNGWGRGLASWYGGEFDGRKTACGNLYAKFALTAASRDIPCWSVVQITNLTNGKHVNLTITDYGPAVSTGRIMDLSQGAARVLGIERPGLGQVDIQILSRGKSGR